MMKNLVGRKGFRNQHRIEKNMIVKINSAIKNHMKVNGAWDKICTSCKEISHGQNVPSTHCCSDPTERYFQMFGHYR
jgi:hypothetical protein